MKYNYLKLAILMMLFILTPERYKLISIIIIILYWIININFRYWVFILIILFVLIKPYIIQVNNSLEGRVRVLSDSYFIINNVVVYYGDLDIDINFDDYVTVETEDINIIEDQLSIYTFNFSTYFKTLNASYSCFPNKITIIKESTSFRAKVYSYVSNIKNEQVKSFYKLILFNIGTNENFLIINGFYFSGVFYVITFLMKWFIDYKYLKYINIVISLIFGLIYHFPLTLIRLIIKKTLIVFDINSKDRLGILIIILLFINSNYIYSLGFIFPISFYFINIFHKNEKVLYYLNSMLIQSIFLYNFKLLNVFIFKYLIKFIGLIYIISIIFLIKPIYSLYLIKVINFIDYFSNMDYKVVGKPSFIVYLILLFVYFKTKKHKYTIITICYLCLMITNISHPFASVTYINVDQGDSILIRLPFNKSNILIDTGKESKYIYVDSYLKAKGITELDYLIITHNDSDHNGNKQALIDNYDVKHIIEKPEDIIVGDFRMISLNNLVYDNDNDNSLVYYFEINNLSFMMMGDISKNIERNILDIYPNINCDILKLSHHGSKTGTDSDVIKKIKPILGIISSGETYHHPHQETIDTLEKNHVFYMQTKVNGDIEIFFNIISDYRKDFAIINNRWY